MIKQLLITILALLGCCTAAWADVQINEENFPDAKFRNWVLSQEYGADALLTDTEIAEVTSIDVRRSKNIQSLKGIEFFTALTELYCSSNQLTELDVSKNTALTSLSCSSNQLTKLNTSGCIALEWLFCPGNQLTELDVSKNTALKWLYCYKNELTALDVLKNTALTTLSCYQNQIKDEAMDALVESLPTVSSGRLEVIWNEEEQNVMTVAQVAAAKTKGWTPFYYDGIWMKYAGSEEGIAINAENFPDANFRNWVLSQEYGKDRVLTDAEIAGVKIIDVNYKYIQNLKGIEYFTALTTLSCYDNQLTALDVSQNIVLTTLYCGYNQLTALDVSKNTALTTLGCYNNQLAVLDVSQNTALTWLSCFSNQLTELDVSQNTALTSLICGDNQLTELDVSKNTALTYLSCYSNQLTEIDVSKNTALTELVCYDNQLTEIDVSGCTALTELDCWLNRLTALDVSKNTALKELSCGRNLLTELDVSQNTALTRLDCEANQIKGAAMDALVESLPTVNGSKMHVIWNEGEQNVMTVEQVAAAKAKGWTPFYYDGRWKEYAGSEEGIAINAENFPDENFRNWVLSQEYGQDGVLTETEIAGIAEIDVGSANIQSLKGIEYFTALTELSCCYNRLRELDVSKNTALETLWCYDNQLTELDVSKNTALTFLSCYSNQLTALDVSKNTALTQLSCYKNQLTELDVSNNTALYYLSCDDNQLTVLDVSKNTALEWLFCSNNQLTALDVSKNTALTQLSCYKNELTALDLSKNTELKYLHCYMNQIKGAAMDALVESLPTVSSGRLEVIWNEEEQNVMTVAQVAAAKTKGWIPFYYDDRWKMYAGSEDEDGISRPTADSGNNGEVYDLSGRRLQRMQKGINIINGKKLLK